MILQKLIAKMRVEIALPIAMFMTVNGWSQDVKYIDSNGDEKTLTSGSYTTLSSCGVYSGSWFVVKENVNCTSQLKLTANPVHLVLADGATLNINVSQTDAIWAYDLNINGQKNQTGVLKLDVTGKNSDKGRDIWVYNLYVYGGNIHAKTTGTDAICATDNVTVNGGSVYAEYKGEENYYGIKAHCTANVFSGHDIFLDWRNATDSIYANSYSGNIAIADGKSFRDANGNIYSGSITTNSDIAGKKLTPEYLVQFINFGNNKKRALVNGAYKGTASVNITSPVEVDSIEYNRSFTAKTPATVVLPFSLPEGTTINAKFYRLKEVVEKKNACAWNATVTYIGSNNLPQANTPYVVLTDGDKLQFNLNNQKATFQATNNPTTTVSEEKWNFIGVYSYKVWEPQNEELGLAYAFAGSNEESIAKGKFGKIAIEENSTDYPFAYPFRAYLKKRDDGVKLECLQAVLGRKSAQYSIGHTSESIDVLFEDETENGEKTTFMARMDTHTSEFTMLPNYDAKGRKIAAPKVRGAYYGKKVLKSKDVQ